MACTVSAVAQVGNATADAARATQQAAGELTILACEVAGLVGRLRY